MRKLSEEHKIPGRSLPEIVSRFNGLVSRQQTMVGRKIHDGQKTRKVPAEVITNATILHFLSLQPNEQDKILDAFVPQLVDLLSIDEPNRTVPAESAPVKHTADLGVVRRTGRKSG